jgi:hypothetical protein
LRVENAAGQVIGYISRRSWLRAALHEEGRGVAATIESIASADGEIFGVVLSVTLTDDPLPVRKFSGEKPRTTIPLSAEALNLHSQAPLVLAEALLTQISPRLSCPCGEVRELPVSSVHEGAQLECPRCGDVQRLDQEDVERVDREIVDLVNRVYAEWELTPPSRESLRSLRRRSDPVAGGSKQIPSKQRTLLNRLLRR